MSYLYTKLILPVIYILLGLNVNKAYKRVVRLNNLTFEELRDHQLKLLKELVDEFEGIENTSSHTQISRILSSMRVKNKVDLQTLNLTKSEIHNTFSRETAGTTGTPLKLFFSKKAIAHQLAVRRYCLALYGIQLGEREARFWGRSETSIKSKSKEKLLNRKVFNFLGNVKLEMEHLRKFKPSYAYGYSSLILHAAKQYDAMEVDPPVLKVVICTAETLSPFQIEFISKVFQCSVVMEYGSTEFDIIGFHCAEHQYHQVNPDLILEESPEGCLITDLNNSLMKMYRYRLGDSLTLSVERCFCGSNLPVIDKIAGRSNKQLVNLPGGKCIHAVVFAYMAEHLNSLGYQVANFKVIQQKLDRFYFKLELVAEPVVAIENAIRAELNDLFVEKVSSDLTVQIGFGVIELDIGKKFDYFECLIANSG